MGYGDRLRKENWLVHPVALSTAQSLVRQYHYARGGSNTAVYIHGLFEMDKDFWDNDCRGIVWWIPPTRSAAEATYPKNWQGVLSLSRLVIIPGIPKNACSFLLSRSMKMIDRSRWPCLVTYADEWQGHTGTIYRATNWEYVGLTKPQPVYTLNGRVISRKAGPYTRTMAEMFNIGCVMQGKFSKHKYIHVVKD